MATGQGSQVTAFSLGTAPWRQRVVTSTAGGSGAGAGGEAVIADEGIELQRELDVVTHPLASSGSITELPVRGVMRPGQIGLRAKEEGQTLEPTSLMGMNPINNNGINGTNTGVPEPLPRDALAVGGTHGVYSSSEPEFPEVCVPGVPGFDDGGFAGPRYHETPDTIALAGSAGIGVNYEDEGESDFDRVEADLKALNRCKFYFILGIFGLPFIHLLNAWYFRRELIGSDGVDTHPQTRQYARGSLLIAAIWLLAIITWYIVFRKVYHENNETALNILNMKVWYQWV